MGGIDRTKDWDRVIMHVDMDAFFAAVEVRNCPWLKGKPVIVGGDPRWRSVVSTCSYEARRYGVHSGMPITRARQLCPDGVFISGTLNGYIYTSAMLQLIFQKYSPVVEPFSVDEAFLELTGCHRVFGTVENVVAQMKEEIREKLSLTCSVGISPTKLMAKMGSGENKPDGMTIMDRDDFRRIFYPRPVDALWGIGEATRKILNKIGIFTVGDLAERKEKELKAHFGKNGESLSILARGMDTNEVYNYENRPMDKSMSHETTLMNDLTEIDKVYSTLLWLSDRVARRLRKDNYVGRTVSVKVRSSDFNTITRDHTLDHPTDQTRVIYEAARNLVPREYGMKIKIRLLGVRVSNLEKKEVSRQMELIEDTAVKKLQATSAAIDRVRNRFGDSAIKLAGTKI
nr:DNA polymerase IV [candidate division Zixibacteria bacterium]